MTFFLEYLTLNCQIPLWSSGCTKNVFYRPYISEPVVLSAGMKPHQYHRRPQPARERARNIYHRSLRIVSLAWLQPIAQPRVSLPKPVAFRWDTLHAIQARQLHEGEQKPKPLAPARYARVPQYCPRLEPSEHQQKWGRLSHRAQSKVMAKLKNYTREKEKCARNH